MDKYKDTLEYIEGRNAYREGIRRNHNPHAAAGDGNSSAWWEGWDYECTTNPHEGTTVCAQCGAIVDLEDKQCFQCGLKRQP